MKALLFALVLAVLTACGTSPSQTPTITTPPDAADAGMPNPASIYCTQGGNRLEIHTEADGSQYGTCVARDGSTCDEWAYYRGECDLAAITIPTQAMTVAPTAHPSADVEEGAPGGYMPPGASEQIADWWGVIKSTDPGAQYDDYFERRDLGQAICFGIDSMDPAVAARIKALRNSGKLVHLYGTLMPNAPDYGGAQIRVDRIEVEE